MRLKVSGTTAGRQTVKLTDPGVHRRQPHLHTLEPLSQCSDLIPELTLPLAHVLCIPPETDQSKDTNKSKLIILSTNKDQCKSV